MSSTIIQTRSEAERAIIPSARVVEPLSKARDLFMLKRRKNTTYRSLSQGQRASFIDQKHEVVFGKSTGWDVVGDLRQLWNDCYFPSIRDTINEPRHKAWIFKRENGIIWNFEYSLYVLGSSVEDAQPTIVTICENLRVARRVSKLIGLIPTI